MFASRNPARAMAEGLPRQDHVWITTNQFDRFHKVEFDDTLCNLDFTEFARLFDKTQPFLKPRGFKKPPAKFWKRDICSVSETAFPGFCGDFFSYEVF